MELGSGMDLSFYIHQGVGSRLPRVCPQQGVVHGVRTRHGSRLLQNKKTIIRELNRHHLQCKSDGNLMFWGSGTFIALFK